MPSLSFRCQVPESHFITIQSISPRNTLGNRAGSRRRFWASVLSSACCNELIRFDGVGASSSRMRRQTSSKPALHQLFRIERRSAREQLVKQHTERVDVAASVDIHSTHLSLLGTHIGRCAHELPKLSEERLVGKASLGGLGDTEIDHLRCGAATVGGYQDVGGFDVAVNDAFLMRVLDGRADFCEDMQPLCC